MDKKEDIVLLIPTLNPDEKLIRLVEELKKNGFNNIIIVNDGSSEKCNKCFEEIENKVKVIIKHAVNLGKR